MEIDVNPALLGTMILLFLIGTVLLWQFIGKPLTKAIDDRADTVRSDLERAEKARADMEALKLEYDRKMSELEEKAHAIISQAVVDAKERSERLEREARDDMQRRKEAALAELERERLRVVHDLKSQVADIALEIASTVLAREVKESDHHKFVQEFISDLDKRGN